MNRRNFLETASKGLVGMVLVGCDMKGPQDFVGKRYELEVGEFARTNWKAVSYKGMINDKVFAVSTSGQSATNQFYPISTKEIKVDKDKFRVEDVNPEKIILTYLGREK